MAMLHGVLSLEHRKIFKDVLNLVQMCKIWYVALPSGPLPSLNHRVHG